MLKKCAGRPGPPGADRSADRRAEAVALLHDRSLTIGAIAGRLGLSKRAVERYNAGAGVRLPQPRKGTLAAWPAARRRAAIRILAAEIDPGDLAEAIGFARETGALLLSTFAPHQRKTSAAPGSAAGPEAWAPVHPAQLRARLTAHIARQIAGLDAALSDAPRAGWDSAKVLRDLGGLKRLLDDLGPGDDGAGGDGGMGGKPRDEPSRSGADGAERDVDGLRAEIARRFDRFVGGGAAA